jgi:quinol monooxygenase YgiN
VVIVGGVFKVLPGSQDAFLAERAALMHSSRAEPGCLEYTFSADPLDPGRVVVFERWATRADLDAHLAALRSGPARPMTVSTESSAITIYDVSGESPLG